MKTQSDETNLSSSLINRGQWVEHYHIFMHLKIYYKHKCIHVVSNYITVKLSIYWRLQHFYIT